MAELSNYRILRTLGEGSFGRVKRNLQAVAEHIATDEKIAIKFIRRELIREKNLQKSVKREIHVMNRLSHPHIIKLYSLPRFDKEKTDKYIILIMEYVPGGELYKYIERHGKLSEELARKHFQQLISAVCYMSIHKVSHRDIKLENLLLDEDVNLKIADFGLSTYTQDGHFLNSVCGSPNYAAPELLSNSKYCGSEVDIWSCGIVLFALLTGHLPFDSPHTPLLVSQIKSGDFKIPNFISPLAEDLITRILNPDPCERITAQQIMKHPWYRESLPLHLQFSEEIVDLDELISLNSVEPNKSRGGLDCEVFDKLICLSKFTELDADLLKEHVLNKDRGSFPVAYSIALECKLKGKRKEMSELDINMTPLFKKGVRRPLFSRENVPELLLNVYSSPSDWKFGVKYGGPMGKLMIHTLEALKACHFEWKRVGFNSLKARIIPGAVQMKFIIYVYRAEGGVILDFLRLAGHPLVFQDCLARVLNGMRVLLSMSNVIYFP